MRATVLRDYDFEPARLRSIVGRFAIVCALAIAGGIVPASAQDADRLSLQASLVTVGPGSGLFSWLGHSAILLTYPGSGEQRVFQYGVVFANAATTHNLVAGTVVAYSTMRDGSQLVAWAKAGRTVAIQRLDLSDVQRTRLIKRLFADNDQRRGYRYDIQLNNCTTRIRDLLDDATDGALRMAGSASTGLTLREIGVRGITRSWVIAMFDVVINDVGETPATRWDAALYPSELSRLVAAATVTRGDGSSRRLELTQPVVAAQPPATNALAHFRIAFLLGGVLLSAIALSLGYAVRRDVRFARALFGIWTAAVGGVFGLLGTVLGAAWLFTDYRFAWHNENLFLFNPLLLATVPLGLWYAGGSVRAQRALSLLLMCCAVGSVFAVCLKTTPAFGQDNWRSLLLALPALAGLVGGLSLAHRAPIRTAGWTHNPVVAGAFRSLMPAHFAPTHSSGWSRIT